MDIPSPHEEQKQEHGVGPIVGVVIIVLIMAVGGIYFFLSETQEVNRENPTEQAPNQ